MGITGQLRQLVGSGVALGVGDAAVSDKVGVFWSVCWVGVGMNVVGVMVGGVGKAVGVGRSVGVMVGAIGLQALNALPRRKRIKIGFMG